MPMIPAFCDSCGTAFPSGISVDNVTNLTMSGNKFGPCPKCGGMGSTPDGTFNVLGSAIEIIRAPHHSVEKLKKLSEILKVARKEAADSDQVAENIKNDVPELASLLDIVPKTRAELYSFLTLLILALSLIINSRCSTDKPDINIQNIMTQSVEQVLTVENELDTCDEE